jgi:hypothetical protein
MEDKKRNENSDKQIKESVDILAELFVCFIDEKAEQKNCLDSDIPKIIN